MSVDPRCFCCLGEADALLRTHLKPVIPKRPAGLLPPQKVGGAVVHVFSSPPSISSAERVQLRSHAPTAQVIHPLLLFIKIHIDFTSTLPRLISWPSSSSEWTPGEFSRCSHSWFPWKRAVSPSPASTEEPLQTGSP